MENALLERPLYTNRARGWFGNRLIKVITGQRRVGKSFILRNLAEICRREHHEWRTILIDKELSCWDHVRDAGSLERAAA